MNLPSLYNPDIVGKWYEPRIAAFQALGRRNKVKPASEDAEPTLVMNIDNPNDFVIPGWPMAVEGAVADAQRFIRWAFVNGERITGFFNTFDRHQEIAITHPGWWRDREGNHPLPFTKIKHQDVLDGKWIALFDPDWSLTYLYLLEKAGKELTVWPVHCVDKTNGQKLLSAIAEMEAYHSAARQTKPYNLYKGMDPHVEQFGAWRAEVLYPGNKKATRFNHKAFNYLRRFKKIMVVGQVYQICVLETLIQTADESPETLSKMHLLTDCMGQIPGYEERTEREYKRLATLGLHFTTTAEAVL